VVKAKDYYAVKICDILLTVPLFPPGSDVIVSPTCKKPDSNRPTTLTTFALDPFDISVIDIRRGNSSDRKGISIDSRNEKVPFLPQTYAFQQCGTLVPRQPWIFTLCNQIYTIESAAWDKPKVCHRIANLR
jgi:hypothetical protein